MGKLEDGGQLCSFCTSKKNMQKSGWMMTEEIEALTKGCERFFKGCAYVGGHPDAGQSIPNLILVDSEKGILACTMQAVSFTIQWSKMRKIVHEEQEVTEKSVAASLVQAGALLSGKTNMAVWGALRKDEKRRVPYLRIDYEDTGMTSTIDFITEDATVAAAYYLAKRKHYLQS